MTMAERNYINEGWGPEDIPCSGCGSPRDECVCGAMLLTVDGKPFRCSCLCNVFRRTAAGNYCCNGCDALYEGSAR